MRGFAFVLLRTGREGIQCIYSEEQATFPLEELVEESCVVFTAKVAEEPRSKMGYELQLLEVEIYMPKIVCAGAEGGVNIFKLEYLEKKHILHKARSFINR